MAAANDAPTPQFMITSPEMADYLNKALTMLRNGESIDGLAERHKVEWKKRQEAVRRAMAEKHGDAAVLTFSGKPITDGEE
jgi:hypothetical protein